MDWYQEYPGAEEAAVPDAAAAGWPGEPPTATATPVPRPATASTTTPARTMFRLRVIVFSVPSQYPFRDNGSPVRRLTGGERSSGPRLASTLAPSARPGQGLPA